MFRDLVNSLHFEPFPYIQYDTVRNVILPDNYYNDVVFPNGASHDEILLQIIPSSFSFYVCGEYFAIRSTFNPRENKFVIRITDGIQEFDTTVRKESLLNFDISNRQSFLSRYVYLAINQIRYFIENYIQRYIKLSDIVLTR